MGIRVQTAAQPFLFCLGPVPPVQIKTLGTAVEFEGHTIIDGRINYFLQVDLVAIAFLQQASGGVSQDTAGGMVDCFNDPLRLLIFEPSLAAASS